VRKQIPILLLVLLIILLVIFAAGWYIHSGEKLPVIPPKTEKQSLEMSFYNKGTKTTIDSGSPYFQQIQAEAENLLVSADNALLELVAPETVKQIKEQESCLELIYAQPKAFTLSFNNLKIRPDHLLIPLSGRFVGETENNGVIFVGSQKAYSSGPYVNRRGISKLKSLLNAAGVKEF